MTVQDLITMQANLAVPPYTLIFWSCYGQPDSTGSQSGFFGQLDPNSIKVNSIVYNNATQNPLTLTVGGDLGGSLPNPTVVGMQGNPISFTSPTSGQVLQWTGTTWLPTSLVQYYSVGNGLSVSGTVLSVGQNADNNILVNSNNIQLNNTQSFTSGYSLSMHQGTIATTAGNLDINVVSGTINLYGSSGVELLNSILQFTTGVTLPKINQADNTTNSATGQLLSINAQNATGTTSIGGALVLASGTGTSANGTVTIQEGGNSVASFAAGTGLTVFKSLLQFGTGASSPVIQQASVSTNSATGQTLAIHAQNATGTTSVGGNLSLAAGTGTSTYGTVVISGQSVSLDDNNGLVKLQINSTGLGFFATTPVAQATRATNAPLTAAAGSASSTINDVGVSFNQATLNNNFKSIVTMLNALEAIIHSCGLST